MLDQAERRKMSKSNGGTITVGIMLDGATEAPHPKDILASLCEAFEKVCEMAGYDTALMFEAAANLARTRQEEAQEDKEERESFKGPKPLFPSKGGDA